MLFHARKKPEEIPAPEGDQKNDRKTNKTHAGYHLNASGAGGNSIFA